MNPCPLCRGTVQPARIALGFHTCASCAQARPVPKYKGAMIYGHKTAASIELMSPDGFAHFKRITKRRGQQSVLRNVLHANGRAV